MELVISNLFNSNVKMTTREISEVTGKRHDHVKRDTDVMFKELGLDAPNFGAIYLDSRNRQQIEYVLDEELHHRIGGLEMLKSIISMTAWLHHRIGGLEI